jgi:glyoxylase-like metal-dependent hydrolase (beta-lactamase superfamily II)
MVRRMAEQQKVGRGPTTVTMEVAAPGVWVMRGGFPHRIMNIYFIEEPDGGVTLFDAGIEAMTKHVVHVGRVMGGINRIVLGHAHSDHRGAAPAAGAPVWCHEAEAQYAEAENPQPYFDFTNLPRWTHAGPMKAMYPSLLRMWDGGPVRVDRTLREGESVAGFEVVHFPGHAPGLIGLWRSRDRLALASDTFYTLDGTTGDFGHPRPPWAGFNDDLEQARGSIRKLAAMEPALAWAGHAEPLRGDVRAQLEQAATAASA